MLCARCNANVPVSGRGRLPKYCSDNCRTLAYKAAKRASHVQTFIGLDGEGINLPDGTHRYVMLSVGDDTLFKNGEALGHRDIFAFLYDHFTHNPDKRMAYIGFYLGYDFTMWLKDITEVEAKLLFTNEGKAKRQRKSSPMPFPVYLRTGWEVDILGMKRLRLRPHVHNGLKRCGCGFNKPQQMVDKNPNEWFYVCDVGSFFQSAFVKVINPTQWPTEKPCTPAEYETIIVGKQARSDKVTLDDLSWVEPMMEYNRLENKILGEVMRIYSSGFNALGVKLNKTAFYGPGQLAQGWLTNQARKGAFISREDITKVTPPDVIDAFRKSYYGGRFEILYHGVIPGTTYEYDIQSAYPNIIRQLPCLCNIKWIWNPHGEDLEKSHDWLLLSHRTVRSSNPFCAGLPWRSKQGSIVYPTQTKGWYREREIEAADDATLVDWDHTILHDRLAGYKLCNHPPPLAKLADLFEERLRVGKSTPYGKALKLVYNSTYGKMAQSVGMPKYANPIYASIITSETRIMLMEAIATHNDPLSLVMMATDGIYFREPHPRMPTPETNIEQLGAWECSTKSNITLMKPGVYWDDKARQAISEGKDAQLRSRGVNGKALQKHILSIDRQFQSWKPGQDMPKFELHVPFGFISPRLALARGKWENCGKVEYDLSRWESADVRPKRFLPHFNNDGLISSFIPKVPEEMNESTPYAKRFGFDEEPGQDVELEYYTQDGHAYEQATHSLFALNERD